MVRATSITIRKEELRFFTAFMHFWLVLFNVSLSVTLFLDDIVYYARDPNLRKSLLFLFALLSHFFIDKR